LKALLRKYVLCYIDRIQKIIPHPIGRKVPVLDPQHLKNTPSCHGNQCVRYKQCINNTCICITDWVNNTGIHSEYPILCQKGKYSVSNPDPGILLNPDPGCC
jgi:hypothetical protein